MLDLKKDVVAYLSTKEDPCTVQGILKGMGLRKSDRQFMRSLLQEMSRDGLLIRSGAKFWVPDGKKRSLEIKREKSKRGHQIVGVLSLAADGYGFVSPPRGKDWFIPEHAIGKARNGDVVRVLKREADQKHRTVGAVVEIVSFGQSKLIGVFHRRGQTVYFFPFGNAKVDQKTLRGTPDDVEDGMVGVFERREDGRWSFLETLGKISDPKVDEAVVLAELDIPLEFSDGVLEEVKTLQSDYQFVLGDRRDFRDELVFTVDGADARDFDDALHVKALEDGYYEVGIHIADVSEFVKPNSLLDLWAKQQGNSVYLPHRAFPMLPEILSNELCSLNPHVERYTVSVVVKLNRKGGLVSFDVFKGLIRSAYRLTYGKVEQLCIEKNESMREEYAEVVPSLDMVMMLSQRMKETRLKSGALSLDMPEMRMSLTPNHEMAELRLVHQTDANRMIEAFMCLANECVAKHMEGYGIPYRIHEGPEPARLSKLAAFLQSFGYPVPDDLNYDTGPALNRLVDMLKDKPNGEILQTQILKSMKMAEYNEVNHGHFGLNSTHYAHFTSPIRRYADLLLHQRLSELLADPSLGPEHFDNEQLSEICAHISKKERDAGKAEQSFKRIKILRKLKDQVGEVFSGIISDAKVFGVLVLMNELHISGYVAVEELGDDRYDYNADMLALVGRWSGKVFKVGVEVKVRLMRVDIIERKLELSLIEGGLTDVNPDDYKPKERGVGLKRGRKDGPRRAAKGSGRTLRSSPQKKDSRSKLKKGNKGKKKKRRG